MLLNASLYSQAFPLAVDRVPVVTRRCEWAETLDSHPVDNRNIAASLESKVEVLELPVRFLQVYVGPGEKYWVHQQRTFQQAAEL